MPATSTFAIYFLSALVLSLRTVLAGPPPTLHYPLQSQLPPVGRVNQTFLWTLLPDTFLSSAALSYAALDMPSWLSFDATSLTFSGQPTIADLGTTQVTVQANASDSAVGTLSSFQCLVSADPAPVVQASIASQLANGDAVYSSAYLQSDGTIRIPMKWSFSIGFQQYTFTDPQDQPIYYSAVRAGTTSLPSWMTFDSGTVTFDGLAPSNDNHFDIELIGSDHQGYGDVRQSFTVVIGSHSFILVDPLPPINATATEEISYNVPLSGILLDNKQVSASNVSAVNVELGNLTNFLSYDESTRVISGSLPATLPSTSDISIPVRFTSAFNNTINTNITLHIIPQLFSNGTLPSYNVTGGKSFTYDLRQYLTSAESEYSATFDPASSSDWLRYNKKTRSLTGTPPVNDGRDVFVNITATDNASGITESAGLTLLYNSPDGVLQKGKKKGGLSNGAKIAIAVVFGILGGILLILLILWLFRKYYKQNDKEDGDDQHNNNDDDATLAASHAEKGKERATPVSHNTGAWSTSSDEEDDRLDEAIAAAEMSVAAALATENQKPRRMDLMRVLGGGKKTSDSGNLPTTNSGRSIKEILGLTNSQKAIQESAAMSTAEAARRHEIIVVTDGDGYTYRPSSSQGTSDEHNSSQEGTQSRSSWDSQQSSSLFYSEESNSTESPGGRSRLGVTNGTPRSIPRQRRDFQPYKVPLKIITDATNDGQGRSNMSPSPSYMPPGGIRVVQPRESIASGSDESHEYSSEAHGDINPAEASIATAHLEILEPPHSANSVHSTESRLSRPRLIPFHSERRPQRTDSLPKEELSPNQQNFESPVVQRSQEGTYLSADSADNSGMTDDADEQQDPILQRYSTLSTPYQIPPELEEAASPMIFGTPTIPSTPPSPPQTQRAAPTSATRSAPNSAKSARSLGYTNSIAAEPIRIHLGAGDPFHFTAQIHPPPPASIGSPGRDGPVRSTYTAYTDYPNEPDFDGLPLPPWLHFDPRELEFWGSPSFEDAGSVAVRVVERKHFPTLGSPSRRRQSVDATTATEESEQIVGRFVLDVVDNRQSVGSLSDVMAATY